jgi:hypothetical protein
MPPSTIIKKPLQLKRKLPLSSKGIEENPHKKPSLTVSAQPEDSTGASMRVTGRVLVSDITMQGLNTKFKEEIEIGDSVSLVNPQSHQVEVRKVTAVLSNRTLQINTPLSSDFVSTVELTVQKKKPWDVADLKETSKEEQLQSRIKLKHDKYC